MHTQTCTHMHVHTCWFFHIPSLSFIMAHLTKMVAEKSAKSWCFQEWGGISCQNFWESGNPEILEKSEACEQGKDCMTGNNNLSPELIIPENIYWVGTMCKVTCSVFYYINSFFLWHGQWDPERFSQWVHCHTARTWQVWDMNEYKLCTPPGDRNASGGRYCVRLAEGRKLSEGKVD